MNANITLKVVDAVLKGMGHSARGKFDLESDKAVMRGDMTCFFLI